MVAGVHKLETPVLGLQLFVIPMCYIIPALVRDHLKGSFLFI
jgi:hypothetical protein